MLTGGTSKYGPPSASNGNKCCCLSLLSPLLLPRYASRPAVTRISGLAFGVSVQSRTPTVTWSTYTAAAAAAAAVADVVSVVWSVAVIVAAFNRGGGLPQSPAAVAVTGAGAAAAAIAVCRCRDALNSRLTASSTRATRSGRSYGSRTTGHTGLSIKRRRHTSGGGLRRTGSCCCGCNRAGGLPLWSSSSWSSWSAVLTTAAGRCRRRRRSRRRRRRSLLSPDAFSAASTVSRVNDIRYLYRLARIGVNRRESARVGGRPPVYI